MCKQALAEKLGQPLAVELAAVTAALVEFVHHAPGATAVYRSAVTVGDAEVRITQPVGAQILSGAGNQQHSGAIARGHFVELLGDAGGKLQIARHRRQRWPARFAVLPGERRLAEQQRTRQRQQPLSRRAHQRIRSL